MFKTNIRKAFGPNILSRIILRGSSQQLSGCSAYILQKERRRHLQDDVDNIHGDSFLLCVSRCVKLPAQHCALGVQTASHVGSISSISHPTVCECDHLYTHKHGATGELEGLAQVCKRSLYTQRQLASVCSDVAPITGEEFWTKKTFGVSDMIYFKDV